MPGPMDRDGNKAYEKQIDEKHRSEQLQQFKGHKPIEKSASDFHHHGINALRKMLEGADPHALETSGDHWRGSADRLAGQDGHGGIRKSFQDAVDHASAHWRGSAAEAFRREAGRVLEKIDRTYGHARNVESMLIGSRASGPRSGIAYNLREAQKTMSGIKDPGKVESAFNSSGDDTQFHKDMANPKMDAKMALELNRDKLSLSKERQVEAVIVMEELAAHYRAHNGQVAPGPPPGGPGDWPTRPDPYSPPPPVNMPVVGGTHPKTSTLSPHSPLSRHNGQGIQRDELGNIKPVAPSARTDLDSVQGGTLTPAHPGIGGGTGGGGSGSGNSNPGGGSGVFVPPGAIGGPGGMGGTMGPGRRGIGGRTGMPGGGAAGRGAPSRTPGKPGGPAGGAKQGGSALHRSRGGTQSPAGKTGGAGMQGATGKRGKDGKERPGKQRPDYLVEDEETWTPERNVAPRVIE
ncbi:hypothetical protein [Streptomyces pinistramenti]|uniref:hypothetical protein n=1 Tax=Streptomyces pinistramenti TaxID=2884812 RepID=UPI001D096CF4|nr:hypothetical protein [Streptomyces pinistramenti]MCB5909542.1 hypothetical protein [Streptomyces pinistramenti]